MSFFDESHFSAGPGGTERKAPEITLGQALETIKIGLLALALTPEGSKATKKVVEIGNRLADKEDPLTKAINSYVTERVMVAMLSFGAARDFRKLKASGFAPTARNARRVSNLVMFAADRFTYSTVGAKARAERIRKYTKEAGADIA
jgi:hypothetical protein